MSPIHLASVSRRYLMDEPEAPLSPRSQLVLLTMIGDMVSQDGQFIIATHSPMLLAFPDAQTRAIPEPDPPRQTPAPLSGAGV